VPFPWAEWFGRAAPIRLEVGFGNGEFLITLAARHPDRNWVGIEASRTSVLKTASRWERHGSPPVRLLHGDAYLLLLLGFGPRTVEAVYFNCPDPWFKKRHHKHRLLQPGMVELLANRLSDGGELWVVTDTQEFRDHLLEVLPGSGFLEPASGSWYVEKLPEGYPVTKYMREGLAAGRTLYCFHGRKVRHAEPDPLDYARRFHLVESLARYTEAVRLRVLEQLRQAGALMEPHPACP
jgi:tRNA (guanine-N7-)-methyltransferase